jgi:hypothetical protein
LDDARDQITSHSSPGTLLDLLVGLGFDEREIQGSPALLRQPARGDWLKRSDAPREMLLPALEEILSASKLPVRFVPVTVEREAYRASGIFQLHPLGGDYSQEHIHLFVNTSDPANEISGGGGSGDLQDFLRYLGGLGRVFITNAVAGTNGGVIQWRQHSSAKKAKLAGDPAAFEQLLKRVSAQSGLRFEKTRSTERVWNIEPGRRN